jgi:hypothetical protein
MNDNQFKPTIGEEDVIIQSFKMTKAKKRMKIEPLQDKFNPPDSWRLSYRRG